MNHAHDLILLAGVLGLCSIFAGLLSARVGAPLLLVFLAVGMLAGEDGPGGLAFDDFRGAYLVGSIALTAILLEGGFKTPLHTLRLALWPALALATLGVVVTAGVVAATAGLAFGVPWGEALLIGAVLAPTDAAAVNTLLRQARLAIPARLEALLEVESGLNDPVSVALTVGVVGALVQPGQATLLHEAGVVALEAGGGLAFGLLGGFGLLALLRRLSAPASMLPVLSLFAALLVFGLSQSLETSGFLAVYVIGLVIGNRGYDTRERMEAFLEAVAWLAQIVLFLLLGLLVTPHLLLADALLISVVAAVLILVARPAATVLCLLPFRLPWRDQAFAAWVGLRGGVPIYLAIIPVLAGLPSGRRLFGIVFATVIASLLVQGWTIGRAGALLGFPRKPG